MVSGSTRNLQFYFTISLLHVLQPLKSTHETIVLGLTCLDCVIDITCGTTFTDRHKGYQSSICVRLTNKESLPIYAKSKEHMAVVALLKPHLKNILAMDYESPRKPGKAAFWSSMPAHCTAGLLVAAAAVVTALFVSKK